MNVIIITGEKEGGKTAFLKELSDHLHKENPNLKGFLSLGVFTDNGCKDFQLQFIPASDSIHLASRKAHKDYFKEGRFFFNPEAINYGNRIIDEAIHSDTDIFIIDEVGPAELNQKVWYQALIKLLKLNDKLLLISVRKRIIDEVITKFQLKEYRIINIEEESASETAKAIRMEFRR